jgi:hypothetical protein
MQHNPISRKKVHYDLSEGLQKYQRKYSRMIEIPITYSDLLRYESAYPLMDKDGKDTYWLSVIYGPFDREEIYTALTRMYSILTADGEYSAMNHLVIDRVDYCEFGNSKPFRIKVQNTLNDNHDYFYVKKADASRVYGLELEHILSPNKINYITWKDTLLEEHIIGIPGDMFLRDYIKDLENVRFAKEFVKFNERCIIRLLGDMRSYNWVVDTTPDFDKVQYRIRAIDFDQQSYEGRLKMYMPQFFRENLPLVEIVMNNISEASVKQYQIEERSLIRKRVRNSRHKLRDLMATMEQDVLTTPEKLEQMKADLSEYHQSNRFAKCKTVGEVLRQHMITSLLLN